MRLRYFTMALAAGALAAVLGLPDVADAGGHGHGGGGGRGGSGGGHSPGGFAGGRSFGGHGGGMPMRSMGAMGMRGPGHMAGPSMGRMGHSGRGRMDMRSMGAMGMPGRGHIGGPGAGRMGMRPMGPQGMAALSHGKSGPMGVHPRSAFRNFHDRRIHGQGLQALNGRPGHMRGPAFSGAGFPHRPAGVANLHGRPFAHHHFRQFGTNPLLRQAAFTRQNAFFHNRFGYRGFQQHPYRWHNWSGRWYGYRWAGAVFWPYWFGDYFSYAFWPNDYYDTFWGYGPDAIVWGAFWPYGEFEYDDYAYESVSAGEIYRPYQRPVTPVAPDPAATLDTCAGFAPGVSDLPMDQLYTIVDATEEQRAAFSDLKAAAVRAAGILKQSCSSETPLTPVARLDAMQHRLTAMAEANDVVRGPLVRLYDLFSDEQKQRLATLAQSSTKSSKAPSRKDLNIAELCSSQASFTNVPAEQIASTIELTDAQKQELDKLKAASAEASQNLNSGCPAMVPDTIDGRLDAAQQRVTALISAVDTVRPAVRDFYASLTDEQKAALSIQPAQKTADSRG